MIPQQHRYTLENEPRYHGWEIQDLPQEDGPLFLRSALHGGTLCLDMESHTCLGILPGYRFLPQRTTLPRGAKLVLYTDGVTEAARAVGSQPGAPRLLDSLRTRREGAAATVNALLEVRAERQGGSLVITLKDGGRPFNPLQHEEPDLSLPAEERPVGGLGIFLTQRMADAVSYARENGCNILTLTKHLN